MPVSASRPLQESRPRRVTISEDVLKFYQEQALEAERLRVENAGLKEIIAEKDKQHAALRGLLQVQEVSTDKWKALAEERGKESKITDELLASWKRTEVNYEIKVAAQAQEISSLKLQRVVWGIIGAGLGYAAGRAQSAVGVR